jgi:RNA recognition motif-containing protein
MGKRIYVGNLPWSINSDQLRDMFSEFGGVKMAEVMVDRETNRSRGFGFVEMDSEDAMNQAIDTLNNKDMNGRPLVVNEARPKTPGGGGGGGYGGGGGGGRDRDRGGYGGRR